MDAVRFGSLMVPVQVTLLLAGVMLAFFVAALFRWKRDVDPRPVLWKMIVFGCVVGRLVFVLRHHEIYFNAPWTIIDFRDGGFESVAGFATGAIVGTELSRRSTALRRPLLIATLTGCLVFVGGNALNDAFTPMGGPVPVVNLFQLDGTTTVPLGSFVGRPLVINLWATWCPPCRREMPVLQAAQLAHPEINFVFVNQGESAAAVQTYLNAIGLQLSNVFFDPAKQMSSRTSSIAYPTTLFYDAQGRLYMRHMGELSQATLNQNINGAFNSHWSARGPCDLAHLVRHKPWQ